MKVLLTGGAGFIGSHCTDIFLENGHDVIIVDDLSSGKRQNIPDKARFYQMDIRDERLKDIIVKELPDCICHLAAQVSVRTSVDDPVKDAEINILGGIKLAKLAVEHNIKKIIFSSTGGAIYGEQEEFPAPESHPLRPTSPYGVSKLSFEKYLEYHYKVFGLKYCILRYANVYGPRQDPFGEAGVVAIFCEHMLKDKQPVINGDGKQTRDFVYAGDVARANLLALGLHDCHCLNIGTGKETTINRIFHLIKGLTNNKAREVHGPSRLGEQKRSAIDPGLAKKVLGWEPAVDLKEGLALTVDYFINQQED